MLRPVISILLAGLLALPVPAEAAKQDYRAHQEILAWMEKYRSKPEPKRLPAFVKQLKAAGVLEDQDNAGLFIGFMAGVLGKSDKKADKLIAELFPMSPKDQGVIIKAIAHSDHPKWKELLVKFSERMPGRTELIKKFLKDEKTFLKTPLENGPYVIDIFWGYYFATSDFRPVSRIISALRWYKDDTKIDEFSVAATAKWTLAANAERNQELLTFYRSELKTREKKTLENLKEVVKAVETYEATRLRKDVMAAVEQRKAKGPKSSFDFASAVGTTALSVGCVALSVASAATLAAGCVLTGAIYSGGVYLYKKSKEE